MAEASGMSEVCKGSESCSQDMEGSETSEDNCNGKPKIKCEVTYDEAVVVLDSNVLGHDTGIKTTPSFSLRTSKLNPFSSSGLPSTPNSKPFVLNPPKLSNPFVKTEKEPESRESICSTPKTPVNEERASTSLNLSKSGVSFLPLGGEATTPSQPSSFTAASTPSLGFVFGQNIHEKVEAATPAESSSVAAAEPSPSKDTQEVTTNGTSSEILFQAPKENTEKTSEGSKSLSEAAREYEEARAVKRKYDEVPVLTGEEEEANVLQGFATPIRMEESAQGIPESNAPLPSLRSSLPQSKNRPFPKLDASFLSKVACRIAPLNTRSENPPPPPPPPRPREEGRTGTRRPVYVRIPPARAPPTQENMVPNYSRMQDHRVPYMAARPPNNIGIFLPPFSFGGAHQLRNAVEDIYNMYCHYIALRFRGLESRQRIYAEKLMTQVIGEAELGNLDEDSRIIVKRRRIEGSAGNVANPNSGHYLPQNNHPYTTHPY